MVLPMARGSRRVHWPVLTSRRHLERRITSEKPTCRSYSVANTFRKFRDMTAGLAWQGIPDGRRNLLWSILLNEVFSLWQQPHLTVREVALKAKPLRLSESAVLLSPNHQGRLASKPRQTGLYLRQVAPTGKNLMSEDPGR